ncbi:sugar MFS transporter [Azotobacter chroococcum]|uniref:Sugar MFS transporter n=1 Tax=Azotobacter chroococcum TaxID=353 RepID=A0A7T5FCQ0_9GAMM|nr:sugar MFS transporter [Azotobacter chroococcum]NHN79308.1 sugar MFS transporter [Azotobacter chroococcum]QQE88548.1 sugar MFS transporter [Azotobacter chroococcum]TBW07061.1 sugar MFS transporter [Azotobacter chroococcum subsp. isscasi]
MTTVETTFSGADSGSLATAQTKKLSLYVFALFFIFGGLTSLNDVLVPKLKSLFSLSYTEAMLVQSAFFFAYFVASIPAGLLIARIGYMKAAVIGLLTMAAGCLLFIPATLSTLFPAFLGALFILAVGVTTVQVVANPLLSLLGPGSTAHSRLTLGQGFNSLGTTVAPYIGAILILGALNEVDPATLSGAELTAFLAHEASVISNTYAGIALVICLIAAIVWLQRNALKSSKKPERLNPFSALDLLKQPRFAFGAACIFLYVGAEVAIGSLLTDYLMLPTTLGMAAEEAGKHVAFYWGGAMVGRFIGAALMRRFAPGKLLAFAATTVIVLLTLSAMSTGTLAGWSLLAVGLFNSIMFPTIFTLASEGLGERAAEGSGLICCAIVGGAIIPPITGFAADLSTLALALAVPAVCYAGIAYFGWYARRPHVAA